MGRLSAAISPATGKVGAQELTRGVHLISNAALWFGSQTSTCIVAMNQHPSLAPADDLPGPHHEQGRPPGWHCARWTGALCALLHHGSTVIRGLRICFRQPHMVFLGCDKIVRPALNSWPPFTQPPPTCGAGAGECCCLARRGLRGRGRQG